MIHTDENFKMKNSVKKFKDAEVDKNCTNFKIQNFVKIKTLKKELVKRKSKLKLELKLLCEKFAWKKSILSNVAKDFKYFEPG